MLCNIMETYINFTQKNIIDYLKIILAEQFDKKIAIDLTNEYIDSRYYNYNIDDSSKTFSKKIFENLNEKHNKLKIKFPKKEDVIFQTFYLFKYIFYIDGIKKGKEIDEIVNGICSRRIIKLKVQSETDETFKKEFTARLVDDSKRRREFLKAFETDKFELIIKNYNFSDTVYDVSIKSNVKFKDIYKEDAIERVFDSGLVAEDKLIVEYNLMTLHIVNDIIKGKFNKKYLINYTTSLLKKKRKNNQILNIVANQTIQEKIVFKVPYREFVKNRFDIYDLMKRGFRFAVIVEKENNIDNVNLNMFKFILVTKEHPKLEKYVSEFKNVVIA